MLLSEVRTTPVGTKCGIVLRSEVLHLAAQRRAQAEQTGSAAGNDRLRCHRWFHVTKA